MNFLIYFFSFIILLCVCDAALLMTQNCEFYNATACNLGIRGRQCSGVESCNATFTSHPDSYIQCYVLWSNTNSTNVSSSHQSGKNVKYMGCFLNNGQCLNNSECVEDAATPRDDNLYCCCVGDMCNAKFKWLPNTSILQDESDGRSKKVEMDYDLLYLLIYTLVPLIILAAIIFASFYIYRQRKHMYIEMYQNDDSRSTESPLLSNLSIQLIQIKAQGRFGAVWKAYCMDELVAVKIFQIQDKQSWLAEQEIYQLPQMDHDNILQFIGVDHRGENLSQEFWLITSFHQKGSLCDYLKANCVSWQELCKIAHSMSNGLAHLHEEIPGGKLGAYKPAIAHRDFKSKNVLIKADMTACVGDFGLALVFRTGTSPGDTHGQVGTRRYMAPEVLEGAINFSCDAFLRIDMYACGLVLWELASRCSVPGIQVENYKLPFEAESNQSNPTLEEIQEIVVHQKLRPHLLKQWRSDPAFNLFCETIEECWDHDAEARLSASCVSERIYNLQHFNYQV